MHVWQTGGKRRQEHFWGGERLKNTPRKCLLLVMNLAFIYVPFQTTLSSHVHLRRPYPAYSSIFSSECALECTDNVGLGSIMLS